MTYIKVANDRAQTQSSLSHDAAEAVSLKVPVEFFFNLINRSLLRAASLEIVRNHEDVLRDSRHTDRRYVNKNQPSAAESARGW